jgi:hypothetical protein
LNSPAWQRGLTALLAVLAVALLAFCIYAFLRRPPDDAVHAAPAQLFDAARAFEDLQRQVELGPRASGSAASVKTAELIVSSLHALGLQPQRQNWMQPTPVGTLPMTNIIVELPGAQPDAQRIVLAAHYDTKRFKNQRFVGANDGASGVAVLLELARDFTQKRPPSAVTLVFLDGEEAMRDWTSTDSLYGSRHLAEVWHREGRLSRISAFILLDMVGDADLGIERDSNSTAWLQKRIWREAQTLNLGKYFTDQRLSVEDDHTPFLRLGVACVDLIDFSYGPNNTYWHTPEDDLSHVSADSLGVVGRVVEATVRNMK